MVIKCDDCDKKATHSIRNRLEVPSDNLQLRKFEYGPIRSGCKKHRKVRITKYLDGTVEQG